MSDILFENEACLVFNKPCGGDSQSPPGLPAALKPVHRLDTPASGCLLLAKTREAAAFLSAAFASPESPVEKRYWAVVEPPKEGVVESLLDGQWREAVHWIRFSPGQNKSFAYPEERPNAKKARLYWSLAGRGERYLFLEIRLITGRHHQIRAQLAALGLFIKGDLKYGARRSEKTGGIRLHARSLRFPNPLDPQESIFLEAPPPKDRLWDSFPGFGEAVGEK